MRFKIVDKEKFSTFRWQMIIMFTGIFLCGLAYGYAVMEWNTYQEMKDFENSPSKYEIKTVQSPFPTPIQIVVSREAILLSRQDVIRKPRFTNEEIKLLEHIVMAEAGIEPYEGQIAVTNVILNRLNHGGYGNTLKEVIYRKCQFSPVGNGTLYKETPSDGVKRAVQEAINGRQVVGSDVLYFLQLKTAKSLLIANTKVKVCVIGSHTFYKNKINTEGEEVK